MDATQQPSLSLASKCKNILHKTHFVIRNKSFNIKLPRSTLRLSFPGNNEPYNGQQGGREVKQEAAIERSPPQNGVAAFFSARRSLTIIFCIMYCLFYLDRVNISQAASSIAKEFSLSNTQLGFAFSAFSLTYMIGQAGGGWFARRYGARAVLTICAVCVSIATIATGLVGGLASG